MKEKKVRKSLQAEINKICGTLLKNGTISLCGDRVLYGGLLSLSEKIDSFIDYEMKYTIINEKKEYAAIDKHKIK